MEAANNALAPPFFTPSYRWSKFPTPPEAMTGIDKEEVISLSKLRSYPDLVPSLSIEVNKI